ncbi:MAG: hypothetical protein KGJ62_10795 [Armatimonadetes bacterium]|nr:hypothetical protein [Armatimonadota bacterium]MDE2206752.1 hypothetical protein [Armatimonadota bacterium]
MICKNCATTHVRSIVEIEPGPAVLSAAAGFAVSAAGTWLMLHIPFGGYFVLILSWVLGRAVGEVVLRVSGRKRGQTLELLTGVAAGVGYLVGSIGPSLLSGVPIAWVGRELIDPWLLIGLGITIWAAVSRIRYL